LSLIGVPKAMQKLLTIIFGFVLGVLLSYLVALVVTAVILWL
jgi:tetrahydromethanopterin S-methyltransferase subunit B